MPVPGYEQRLAEPAEIEGLWATLESNAELFGPCHPETLAVAHSLATAFWCSGEIDRAIGLLDQALDRLTSLDEDHPMRADILSTLGEIMFEQQHLEQAGEVRREVWECRVRHAGANHPDTLAAKGDLAAVLFVLGEVEEAARLEHEAFESARTHLDKSHPVMSALAWNRALSYERSGDPHSARAVIVSDLVWLLAEDPSCLEPDQSTIRTMLVERLNWDAAAAHC
jgi:tetratricopeptide (TPR) repeat protein